jgi:alanine racemase
MSLPLFKKSYHSLNAIEVSKTALVHNFNYLSGLATDIVIAPVLKSNAYGHGLQHVAKALDSVGAPFFCVDSLFEAYELLKIDIKTPILIMGYTDPENLKVKKLPFSFAVFDKATLAVLNKYQSGCNIHIFVDTGMHREGITLDELPEFLEYAVSLKNIKIEGLMSHFAASDQFANPLTVEQVKNFQTALKIVKQVGIQPEWIHIGNSAASLLPKKYKGKIGNLIRAGIASYGIGGEVNDKNLKPALRVLTTIGQIKKIRKGEKIGYDFTYTAKKDMTLGVLPYGYYDGMDRRLSNKGSVLVDGLVCPIIGRVSMNITVIDISTIPNPKVGQTVIIYSDDPNDKNSFQNVGKLTRTIQRDLLVHLSESTKRILNT